MRKFYLLLLAFFAVINFYGQDFRFGKVSEEEVMEKQHPKDSSANAAVLFREHNVYYELSENTGITLITDVHERIKIYNKDGMDWATKKIKTYKDGGGIYEEVNGLKAYTYNIVDGKLEDEKLKKSEVFEEDESKYTQITKFTMPAVKEGSVVEWKYTVRSPFLTSIDMIPLQFSIPLNRLESQITIPEFYMFKKHFNPKSPILFKIDEDRKSFSYNYTTTNRSASNGFQAVRNSFSQNKVEYLENRYSIKKSDIPALKKEVYVDYLENYAAFLKWELMYTKFPNSPIENYSQTWEDVAETMYHEMRYDEELGKTGYFKKDLDAMLAGVSQPMQKALIIYNFVKSKVKWNKYVGLTPDNGLRKAYKDGEGSVADINLMLIAMLKYAGLTANPVLTSTPDHGIPIFPTNKGFNYVIAGIETPGETILLDATDDKAAFAELPERARNWQGRLVRSRGSSTWVKLIPTTKSKNQRVVNIKLDEDFKAKGKAMHIMDGLYAKEYRDNYLGVNKEDYLRILEKDKGNIVISGLETKDDKSIGKDIKQSYEFELENGVEAINGKIYIKPLFFMAMKENPFKAAERSYPIFFDFPSEKDNTVNLMIPEGYKIESIPESGITDLNNGQGVYKYIIHQNGNFIRVQSVLDLNTIVFSPKDYESLKNFYSHILDKQNEVIVLSKT